MIIVVVGNRLDLGLSPHIQSLPYHRRYRLNLALRIQRYSNTASIRHSSTAVQQYNALPPSHRDVHPHLPPSPVNPTGRWRSETWAWAAALARQPRHILSAQSRVSSPLNQPLVCFTATVQSSPGSSPGRSACVMFLPGGRGRDIGGGGGLGPTVPGGSSLQACTLCTSLCTVLPDPISDPSHALAQSKSARNKRRSVFTRRTLLRLLSLLVPFDAGLWTVRIPFACCLVPNRS